MYVVISPRMSETIGLQSQMAADQEPQILWFSASLVLSTACSVVLLG